MINQFCEPYRKNFLTSIQLNLFFFESMYSIQTQTWANT